jgi:hypothetical protein
MSTERLTNSCACDQELVLAESSRVVNVVRPVPMTKSPVSRRYNGNSPRLASAATTGSTVGDYQNSILLLDAAGRRWY